MSDERTTGPVCDNCGGPCPDPDPDLAAHGVRICDACEDRAAKELLHAAAADLLKYAQEEESWNKCVTRADERRWYDGRGFITNCPRIEVRDYLHNLRAAALAKARGEPHTERTTP